MQVTLRQVYNDSRLAYREGNGAPEHITLSGDELDTIWQPDTFVRNERKLVFHENLQSYSAPNMYARIYPDGKIQMSQRVTMQLSCPKLKYQLEASNEAQCSMDLASCKYFYHLPFRHRYRKIFLRSKKPEFCLFLPLYTVLVSAV